MIIPFSLFGFVAFLWFCTSGFLALVRKRRYGDPQLSGINTFLLAYFCARLLMYFIFYGQFEIDLAQFTGIVGLSLAINGGIRRGVDVREPQFLPSQAIAAVPA